MPVMSSQVSDIKDALASLYGVAPKIQCLPPEQVRALAASVPTAEFPVCCLCVWGGGTYTCVCTRVVQACAV